MASAKSVFRPTLVTDFANAKPDNAELILRPNYPDMTFPKPDNADPHYAPKNVKYTPLRGGGAPGVRPQISHTRITARTKNMEDLKIEVVGPKLGRQFPQGLTVTKVPVLEEEPEVQILQTIGYGQKKTASSTRDPGNAMRGSYAGGRASNSTLTSRVSSCPVPTRFSSNLKLKQPGRSKMSLVQPKVIVRKLSLAKAEPSKQALLSRPPRRHMRKATPGPRLKDSLARLCRLCGLVQEVTFPLCEKVGLVAEVGNMLQLEVDVEAAGWPEVVCRRCCDQGQRLVEFKTVVMKGQEELRRLVVVEGRAAEEQVVRVDLEESKCQAEMGGELEDLQEDPLGESMQTDVEMGN